MKMIPGKATESELDVVELKFNRLIEEMRDLRKHVITYEARLRGIEACLKPSEQQPENKPRSRFDVAGVTVRTTLFAVGIVVGAILTKIYFGALT